MNYYIQGDAAKADKIKAAFEKKGLITSGHDYHNDNILFFTYDLEGECKVISSTNANLIMAKLIKSHPDYKELELSVEPKFKVGDWVVRKDGTTFYGGNYAEQITLIEVDEKGKCMWLSSTSWVNDDAIRPWTIADAKDGDVLCTYECGEPKIVFILRGDPEGNFSVLSYHCYYNIMYPHFEPDAERGCLAPKREDVKPAAKEQRDLLFQKMEEDGYEWDAEKKELRKIKPHYDIKNFQPFDKVLIRDSNGLKWTADLFSYIDDGFVCTGGIPCRQCIPFNNDTKHLLGTTDMPSEEYINW